MKTIEIKIIDENGTYVCKNDIKNSIRGSQRMLSIGGGIKAQLVKTKEGYSIVEKYIFDKDRFSPESAEKWLINNKESIEESLKSVKENAPEGSFEDITLRIQKAISDSPYFTNQDNPYEPISVPYVCYVFSDYVIAKKDEQYVKIPYVDENGIIKLGKPQNVEMTFVVKEAKILNEKLNRLGKANFEIEKEFTLFKVEEGSIDEEKRTFNVVLIESGVNFSKKRFYPLRTIQESADLFAGLKMYANHPTEKEERERPERDIKDWVATIIESWYENGKAMGKIHVHNKELLENMKDPIYRQHIGLSINASGRRSLKTIDGMQMEVIEKIISPRSVDFVTEPGARGRIEESQSTKGEIKKMEITIQYLKENHAELVKQIETDALSSLKESNSKEMKSLTERAEKAEKDLADLKALESKKLWEGKVDSILAESKLPKKSLERVKASLSYKECADDVLQKDVKEAIQKEAEYLKEVAGIKIGIDSGSPTDKMQVIEKEVCEAFGIKSE